MAVMGGPVVVLYVLSIGLAWVFGRKRPDAGDAGSPTHAIVFLLAADWLRRRSVELLSSVNGLSASARPRGV
jgi:hypothetical protein